MHSFNLSRWVFLFLFLFGFISGLYFAREFIIPLAFAMLFSMLLLPLCRWIESKGIHRGIAALLSILTILLVLGALIWLLSWQISTFSDELGNIKQKISGLVTKAKDYISTTLKIPPEQQKQMTQSSGSGGPGKMVTTALSTVSGILVDFILILVYIFLLLYFRTHLKKFVMMQVKADEKPEAKKMIEDSSKVAQQYLSGLGLMIVCLWIMYGIGFTIVGVKHAIFFAILCGVLEIIPFVGNLTGTTLTVLMAVSQGGSSGMIIGIIITYMIVQFIQTYILEPLVVGAEVNINPLFTILVLVAGELIWGIAGLVLAIPLLGIVKIICDHVDPLKPYGFLIGGEKKKKKNTGLVSKMKGWFGKS